MNRKRVMLAACAVGGVGGWNIANTGAAVSQLTTSYGVGTTEIGLLSSILFLSQVLCQIPTGHFVDRIGARNSAFLCTAIFGLANLAACATANYELGLVCRAAMGPAMALSFIAGTSYIRGAQGSSFAQGAFGGVSAGFGGLALAIVPALTAQYGWRTPFLTGAVIAALALPLIAAAPELRPRPDGDGGMRRVVNLAKDRLLWKLSVIQAGAFGLNAVIANWSVLLLERNAGASARVAGLAGALTLVGGMLSRPLGGLFVSRRPECTRLVLTSALVLGALATATLAAGPPIGVAVAAALAVGLASGVPFGPTMDLAGRSHPASPGTAIAILNTGAMLAIVLGTPAIGATFSLPGDGRAGFAALALLWLVAIPATSAFSRRAG